jgi:tRNA (adenine37-N6)-methyltransferase
MVPFLKSLSDVTLEPIGRIRTPFQDRFGIPRQSGLTPSVEGVVEIALPWSAAIKGLESFSHIWLIFLFHEHGAKTVRPTIRPPRLGGYDRLGVFATRSPHRPCPIGMSVVPLLSVREATPKERKEGIGSLVHVGGVDLLDCTPILDVKPYIPYADSVSTANSGWVGEEPLPRLPVSFRTEALDDIQKHFAMQTEAADLYRQQVSEVLSLDPRTPAQKRRWPSMSSEGLARRYGMAFGGVEVKYQMTAEGIQVTRVVTISREGSPRTSRSSEKKN